MLIATYSFSARIAGVRTQKIAVSFSVYNILVLISRTANGFQAPLLANYIEKTLANIYILDPEYVFRLILLIYSLATLIGIITTPIMQRLLTLVIKNVNENQTIFKSLFIVFKENIKETNKLRLPNKENINSLLEIKSYNFKIFIYNIIGTAILSTGVISAIYAGYLNPEFRATSSNLSALINGFATLIMFLVVDPYLSILVDNVKNDRKKRIIF
ncbi:MAG: DUF2837 family protein [Flavobacterium sp.]|nr:DUF2837 family protein [Flavobacterium sp.]